MSKLQVFYQQSLSENRRQVGASGNPVTRLRNTVTTFTMATTAQADEEIIESELGVFDFHLCHIVGSIYSTYLAAHGILGSGS